MTTSAKYGRTPHLPFSPGGTGDDRRLVNVEHLLHVPVVISEKLDGSDVTFTRNTVFARSHAGAPKHPSFDMAKQVHAGIAHLIPPNLSVFGEWCYAKHSIAYTALPCYFNIFGVRDDVTGMWWSWEEVTLMAEELGLVTVPVLFVGTFETTKELQTKVELLAAQPSACGGEREGVVIRKAEGYLNLEDNLGKWVRANHVQTDEHWSHQTIVRNGLA